MGCGAKNHPYRQVCFTCLLPRDAKPFIAPVREAALLGSRIYPTCSVDWRGLHFTVSSPVLPVGSIDYLYSSVGLIVFAGKQCTPLFPPRCIQTLLVKVSAPLPFIALYMQRDLTLQRSPQEWILFTLMDESGESPWAFVMRLKEHLAGCPGLSHVETMTVTTGCDAKRLFGHVRFFEDPLTVCAGAFENVYTKKGIADDLLE